VKGEVGGGCIGAEGAGVFLFIHQFDFSYPDTIIIEVEVLWVIDGVTTDLDTVSDIGRWYLVDRAFEADSGIVIDHAFMADEEDLIQLCPGESSYGYFLKGCIVSIDRSLSYAGVHFMVVVLLEPQPEGLIKLLQRDTLLYTAEETIADGAESSFNFPP